MTLMELAIKYHLVYFHMSLWLCRRNHDSLASTFQRGQSHTGISKTEGDKKISGFSVISNEKTLEESDAGKPNDHLDKS